MVRKVVCLAVVATLAVGVAFVSGRLLARADDAAPGNRPAGSFAGQCPVAVIDVAAVFDNCEAFKVRIAEMKERLAQKKKDFNAESLHIQAFEEQLRNLDPQSEEYRQFEEQVQARRTVQVERAKRFNKDLMIIEAEAYAAVFKELEDVIEKYAQAHGIRLVIRCSNKPLDPNVPVSVMRGVNRDILFQDGIDITEEVTRWLNDKKVS